MAVITGADWWSLRHPIGVVANYTDGPVEYLRHGALVTVVNDLSTRLLCVDSSAESQQPASDPIPVVAVATDRNNSGGLQAQGGSGGAEWVVEIASYEMRGAVNIAPSDNITDWDPEVLHPLATLFRLRHAATGCVLAALPAAASDDTNVGAPVVCVPDPLRTGVDGAAVDDLWRVTLSVDLRIGFESNMRGKVRTSFTENLFALNAVMARANNDLVPDPDRYDVLESPPWSWPFLIYPMRMGGWYRAEEAMEHGAYYEIGNPLLWWATATLCCVLYPLRAAVALYSWKRARKPIRVGAGWLLWSGWAMHYLPFFLMSRITYLHHYLPALYYALLLLAYECDKLATRCGGRSARRALLVVLSLLVFAVFWNFRICTFGWYGQPPAAGLARLRWLPSWNIAGSAYD
ncbi:dolichyl-phosphate-mannose-protein mannosyltransferase [Coemansia biformis]|uniref:Dolichyl-phosphate-mannose--protein mannosyltransferase n=1 Tax=Coemansia biformis TaxID=1286918 RepID=A0A9W8CZB7_9FUNG|nr:dolichyl-phosphate-mannose-protein mannosyltransferase [Coemansia biformis]